MTESFKSADRVLFTSESVTEGHPDKLCDQVSDAMLDECLRQDPNSRVACETATTTGVILVAGEVTTHAYVDVPHLVRGVVQARKDGTLPYLRPDGKTQVTVEYEKGVPKRVHTVVVAAQHDPGIDYQRLCNEIREQVIRPAIGDSWLDKTKYLVNGTGAFTIGGPMGDAGLTGRKIIVDTYGGYARHGGGAFSGKDATKVDRSAAYAARYVAKNVVKAGLADRFELQLAYVIGGAQPISLNVETFGTGKVADETIRKLIAEHFDFRPGAIIERFGLRRPIFRQTATYGHFGRPDLPWEKTDLAETFAKAAGATAALA